MKKINWINNFIEEQKTKGKNKQFLKNIDLLEEFKINSENFKFIEKQVKNFDDIIIIILKDMRVLSTEISDLIDFYNRLEKNLKKKISIQKGRITRQTKEQNEEKIILDNLSSKIKLIEKKLEKNGKN